jgi:gas vesicle protein
MRGGLLSWILVAVGLVLLIAVVAAIGGRDDSDETVPAGAWAQNVCGAVAVWRGDIEAIVEDVRTPNATSTAGSQEPQSETPQGRTGFVRKGVERAVLATETMIEGVDNAGTPDTENGDEAAQVVSDWADSVLDDLEEAQDSLDEEADTLEESIEQFADAARSVASALTGGVQAVADVARADPAVARALSESSTCRVLRKEASS